MLVKPDLILANSSFDSFYALGDFGDRYFGTFGYDEGLWG